MSADRRLSAPAKVIPLRAGVRPPLGAAPKPHPAASSELTDDPHLDRRQRAMLRDCGFTAAAYAIDGVLLALFAFAGTVSPAASLLYGGLGLAVTASVALAISNGASATWRDPGLTRVQAAAAMALCLLGMGLFPAVGFVYALSLFIVFLTATYRLPVRDAAIAWVSVALGAGVLTLSSPEGALRIPDRHAGEQVIAWACFASAIGRCLVVSLYTNTNNALLGQRNKQLAATLAQVERLASHDELTGVMNRRSLLRVLAEEIARADRLGSPVSVALLDLDKFKRINDELGHGAGDRVLTLFADLVSRMARETDRFGRYGGEEFLLILTDTPAGDAQRAVDRIRGALPSVDWGCVVGYSAGVACYQQGESLEQLLARADDALYVAKNAGRGCTRVA